MLNVKVLTMLENVFPYFEHLNSIKVPLSVCKVNPISSLFCLFCCQGSNLPPQLYKAVLLKATKRKIALFIAI